MSKQAVEAVIGRAVLESDFREALYANPEEVLGGYDLSEEEMATLKAIDAETLESFAGTLDERISKAVVLDGSGFGDASQGAILEPGMPSGSGGHQAT